MPRPRLSISQVSTRAWTFDEDVARYAAAGVEGIGVWRGKLHRFGLAEAKAILEETGVSVANLIAEIPLAGEGSGMTAPEFEHGLAVLDIARELGTDLVIVIPGNSLGRSTEMMRTLTLNALRDLAPYAAARGVRLALEAIRAPFRDYLHTLEDTLSIVHEVDHPAVGAVVDTWHVWDEPRLLDAIRSETDRIFCVQFSDFRQPTRSRDDRLLPGDGVSNLMEMLTAIHRAGYRGWYDLELFSTDLWSGDNGLIVERTVEWFERFRRAVSSGSD